MDTLYRVLNPSEEPKGHLLFTNEIESQFRRDVYDYRFLSHDIYILALKTGLQIKNAVRVAENVPAFIDELQLFFDSDEQEYDLIQLMVDDPIRSISKEELYNFTIHYITHMAESQLCYDWGNDHYLWEFIWEMVRNNEFPEMPSRMESLFLFDNLENAKDFKNQYRDANYQIANVNLIEGAMQSFDMNWFSNVPSNMPLTEVQDYARNYWGQKQTDKPITEVLFQGIFQWD